MAETLDALVLAARFDQTGLDALPTAVNAALRKAQQGVPALDINTQPFQASLARAGISAQDFSAGFQDAVNDFGGADALLKQLARDAENTATGSQKMAAGFKAAGAAAREASAGTQAWERGLAALQAQNVAVVRAAATSTRATNLLRGGLTQLAVQATGTSGALGQVAQAIAFAAGGATGAIAAAAAIGALAFAYNKLTEGTRKAREELDKYLDQQRALNAASRSPLAKIIDDAKEARDRTAELTAEFAKIQRTNAALGTSRLTPRQNEIVEALEVQAATIRRLGREQATLFGDAEQEAADEAARAHDKATEAARRHREELERIHNVARQIGDENRTQSSGGTAQLPAIGSLAGASREDIGAHREKLVNDTREAAQATLALAAATAQWAKEEADALKASEAAFDVERITAFTDELHGAVDVAFALADAFGQLDEQTAQVLNSIEGLGTAIATGNIFGAISSGIGLLGGLFGGGQSQTDRILEENNRRLEELSGSLDRFKGVAGLDDIGDLAATALPFSQGGTGIIGFDKALREAGISLEAYAKVARDTTGIEILDDKGRLSAEALEQLRQATEAMTEAAEAEASRRGTDVSAEEARLRREDLLGIGGRSADPDVAAVERARQIQLDALHLSEAEEARIAALDLSTKEGREAFLDWQRDLFKRAEGLTKEERGAFENVGELDQSIENAADSILAMDDAAAKAAETFGDFNLPAGFKRGGTGFDVMPFGPSRGNDGAALPGVTRIDGSKPINTTNVGGVTFNITESKNPEETARVVRRELFNIGLVQSGDTMQLGLR